MELGILLGNSIQFDLMQGLEDPTVILWEGGYVRRSYWTFMGPRFSTP